MSFKATNKHMRFGNKMKASIAAMALMSGLGYSGSALADHDGSLQSWAKQADQSVDDVMHYPSFAAKRGESGQSVFSVTVDRDGNVIESTLQSSYGDASLRSAARRVVKRADFPALPANYEEDALTFSLQLSYHSVGSAAEARALARETEVRSESLSSGTPVAGRITLLTQASD